MEKTIKTFLQCIIFKLKPNNETFIEMSIGQISNYRRNKIIVGKASFSRLCYYCYYYYYYYYYYFLLQQNFLSCVRAQFLFNNLFSQKDFFKREGIKKIHSWNFYLFSDLQPKLSESSSGALPLHIPHKSGNKKALVAAFFLLEKFCQNVKFKSEVFV